MFTLRHSDADVLYGVLFDIASGSVGAAIVVSTKEARLPKILFSHRVTMRVAKRAGGTEENLRRIREALFSAALEVSQKGYETLRTESPDARITKLYVTCASPWSYTVARNVHYENDHPFKITRPLLDDLIHSAEEEIITHLRESALLREEQFTVVERATVDISVNEYPVTDPLSLEGSTLDLSHVIGAIPEDILAAVHDVQNKLFPQTELRTHTYMLVMYCVLRDILPKLHSICIVDITSEATELGIVEHNLLTENLSISYGISTCIRAVAEETGNPISDIQSLLVHNTPSAALTKEGARYVAELEKALNDLLSRRIVPSDVVITADSATQDFFKPLVEQALQNANITPLRSIAIDEKLVLEVGNGTEADVYLALGARFFHKLHGCGEIDAD